MLEVILNGVAAILFIAALFFYKLSKREIYYDKVALICMALVLISLSTFLDSYIAYGLQLLLLFAFAHLAREYYKRGLFRRKKELHALYISRRRGHKEVRRILYPHLQILEAKERKLSKLEENIHSKREELKEQVRKIKGKKKELAQARKDAKDAHFEALAIREEEE